MSPFEEALIQRLDLIHNDLETLALATLMLPPPLICATIAPGPERDAMMNLVSELRKVHLRASTSTSARHG
jgi:hypothetical protein